MFGRNSSRYFHFALFALAAVGFSADALGDENATKQRKDTPRLNDQIAAFLQNYCIDCHSTDASEGDREFESFSLPLTDELQVIAADEIVDQLTLRQMPPESAQQPSDQELVDTLTLLRSAILGARERLDSSDARTVLRRLSNREYENSLAMLFDRRVDTLGLTLGFPKDSTVQHMDNVGQALVTSGFLLDQYFQAADRLVELRLGRQKPAPRTWYFTDNFRQYEELSGAHKSFFKYEYLALYEQPNTDTRQGGYAHIEDFLSGVPASGNYTIRARAQAMHRDTHYDPEIFRIDFSEPFQLAVVPGDVLAGHIHYPQPIEPVLAKTVVPDDQPEWLEFNVWLEEGQTPRFIFPNGPYESRASVIEVNQRYKDEFDPDMYRSGVVRTHILREGALPHIKISDVEIFGPIAEPAGSREELAVFGPEGFREDRAKQQLFAFSRKAYRRPLTPDDESRLEKVYEAGIAEGKSSRQSALDTVKYILCSPSFLYFTEITQPDDSQLNTNDLAVRLSFALWGSPPDKELLQLAESGSLADTSAFSDQIDRLLADPRSDEFVAAFTEGWLGLRDMGDSPPPRKSAVLYYSQNLPDSMKQEVRLLFRHVLEENLSALELLTADFSFVDKKLASWYGLPEAQQLRLADGFRRVQLPSNLNRGGILGMAATLTANSNGTETSPVTRGVWVSENILGIHPPPPPDEVPALDANVSGAKNIREKLALHSQDETCNVCHRKIDPLGYALESFDSVGRWRDKYPNASGDSAKIDTSGTLPSGERYHDFASFRQMIAQQRGERFVRALTEKLLVYSTGRLMERVDQYEIDEILDPLRSENFPLRDLIDAVLHSHIFRAP
ncbi:MAG TPA: hypothetical protein DDW52_04740 [Planctomycetaceae bacterium]|nr:hypothetical protein [Planctomycetaceae bacterium]